MARVLVLSPGFPTRDVPDYTPGIVETLAHVASMHDLTIHSIREKPRRGKHELRGLTVVGHGRLPKVVRALSLFGSAARAPRADVVWSLWPDRTGPLALAIAQALGASCVASLLGGELAAIPELEYGFARRPAARALLSLVLAGARAITVGSAFMRARLAPWARAKTEIAPMGIDAERFLTVRKDSWSTGQRLRLVAVSDLSPVKRMPLALAAVELLRAQGIDAELDIFGFAAGRESLPAHRGFVPPEELARLLPTYHALVHPSAHESQGLALVEAALCGLPIACTRVGVAEELAAAGAAVELVDHPSPEALSRAILRAASRTSSDASAIRARFDATMCARRFAEILEAAACGS